MYYIAGLNEKAEEYMVENSNFISYADNSVPNIGCKKSDGFIKIDSSMYKKEELNDGVIVALFQYTLKDDIVVYEVVQEYKNNIVFLLLKTNDGKKFKWTKKEMTGFIEKFEQL